MLAVVVVFNWWGILIFGIVGFAAVFPDITRSDALPNDSSMHLAKMTAINTTLKI